MRRPVSESPWLSDQRLRGLMREIVDRTVKQYRIAPEDAERIIGESLTSNAALKKVVAQSPSPDQLKRSRAFKRAVSEAKRQVYYQLRSYQPSIASDADPRAVLDSLLDPRAHDGANDECERARRLVLERHASTRERSPAASEFYEQLFRRLDPPRLVLDVGCGVHPLMFPFDHPGAERIEQYVALEKSPDDVAVVEAYARRFRSDTMLPLAWDLGDGWSGVVERTGCAEFDLALLMKLAPVIHRQQRELLPVLAAAPARTWLVTGSRISMTKRVSIERRERRVLREFVKMAGREVRDEFVVGEEFAWIVD